MILKSLKILVKTLRVLFTNIKLIIQQISKVIYDKYDFNIDSVMNGDYINIIILII